MKIIHSIKEMRDLSKQLNSSDETIGFVPTMGFLHDGHLHLMKQAKEENSKVIASIFVNPLQFGPNEDFASYPRDITRDEALAKDIGVDYLFYPTTEEMYPSELSVKINVTKRIDVLCGRKREGHFDGVATVLIKLFNIIQPTNVYFGLKDAQQVAVVDGLIQDLNIPVTLKAIETVREDDGLAKSSRNVYLSTKERNEAPSIYQSLQYGKKLVQEGERNPATLVSKVTHFLQERIDAKIDYVELYSYPDLQPLKEIKGKIILAIAVQFQKARLIDNCIMGRNEL